MRHVTIRIWIRIWNSTRHFIANVAIVAIVDNVDNVAIVDNVDNVGNVGNIDNVAIVDNVDNVAIVDNVDNVAIVDNVGNIDNADNDDNASINTVEAIWNNNLDEFCGYSAIPILLMTDGHTLQYWS